MRRAAVSILVVVLAGCAAKTPPAAAPDAHAPERLSAAEALVRAGCFDCLLAAHREYVILRAFPRVAEAATAGAIRTAALLAARERELGTEDSGYLQRARELVASTDATNQQALVTALEITDTLLTRGGTRQIGDDVELARMQMANRNREDRK